MKRVLKTVFKPILVLVVCMAIGVLLFLKKMIVLLHVKWQYKNLDKLDEAIRKLYTFVFNPYRISNGIRPNLMVAHKPSAFDMEQCHNLIRMNKQQFSERRK